MFEAISKFGFKYNDFSTMISNISFFLRTLSLNVDPRNQKPIPIIFTVLNIIFMASYCYIYLFSMVWFVFWKCKQTGELLQALIVFSLGAASEMGIYKFLFMLLHRKKIKEMVAHCYAIDAQVEAGSKFSVNLLKTLREVKKRAILFFCVLIGNGITYIMKAVLLPGRHLMEDTFIIYGLEPIFESPNYEIIFILSAMGVCVTVYFPSNTTCFQIVIAGYLEAQMLAWSKELLCLCDDAEETYKCDVPETQLEYGPKLWNKEKYIIVNRYVNRRLKYIVKAHVENLRLLKMMEDVYQGSIAVEFSLLILCLIVELLGGLENTYLQLPFALIQVGMDCFLGQRLVDAGLVFERAVYECKWENFDKDNMKMVLMMLRSSQKNMVLTAGGITALSYISLMAIFKFIFSAYTTFRG